MFLARELVDNPDDVSVERVERESGELLLELHVAPRGCRQGDRQAGPDRPLAADGRQGVRPCVRAAACMSRSQPDPDRSRLIVGTVGRPHGLDGSFHLAGHGGDVALDAGLEVEVGERTARIAARKGTADRPILRLDIAASREEAEALRGFPVSVDRAELPDPDEGEFFQADLVGLLGVGRRPAAG